MYFHACPNSVCGILCVPIHMACHPIPRQTGHCEHYHHADLRTNPTQPGRFSPLLPLSLSLLLSSLREGGRTGHILKEGRRTEEHGMAWPPPACLPPSCRLPWHRDMAFASGNDRSYIQPDHVWKWHLSIMACGLQLRKEGMDFSHLSLSSMWDATMAWFLVWFVLLVQFMRFLLSLSPYTQLLFSSFSYGSLSVISLATSFWTFILTPPLFSTLPVFLLPFFLTLLLLCFSSWYLLLPTYLLYISLLSLSIYITLWLYPKTF